MATAKDTLKTPETDTDKKGVHKKESDKKEAEKQTDQKETDKKDVDLEKAGVLPNVDEQALLVPSLLNYDAPHYFARFTVVGCPPGLEILDKYEHLLVIRRLQNAIDMSESKRLLAYSQFDVKNHRGMQLYIGLEKVRRRTLNWIRDARLFEVSFFDFHCRKVFTVKRKMTFKYFFAQYFCLLFTFGFKGCGNVVEVVLPDGKKIGSINQKLSFSSASIFHVYNAKGKCIMVIDGVVSDGILDVTFPEDDEPIAMIETLMDDTEAYDFYRVSVPTHSSVTGITFFKNFVTPEQKALLLSVTILLDYIALKSTSDYIHFSEVIPDDYQEYPTPHFRLYKQASKELLILSEGKKKKAKAKLRGRWGCCIWCGKLMCMCFFLGMKRNAVRCTCLSIATVLVLTLLMLFAMGFINFFKSVFFHS